MNENVYICRTMKKKKECSLISLHLVTSRNAIKTWGLFAQPQFANLSPSLEN